MFCKILSLLGAQIHVLYLAGKISAIWQCALGRDDLGWSAWDDF